MKRQRAGRIAAREKNQQNQSRDASISEDCAFPEPPPEGVLSRQAVAGKLAVLPARHDPRSDYDGDESNRVPDQKHHGVQAFRLDNAACFQDQHYNFLEGGLEGDDDGQKDQQAPARAQPDWSDENLLCSH